MANSEPEAGTRSRWQAGCGRQGLSLLCRAVGRSLLAVLIADAGCTHGASGPVRPLESFQFPPMRLLPADATAADPSTRGPGDDTAAPPFLLWADDDPAPQPDDRAAETPAEECEPDLEAFDRDRRGFVPPSTRGDEYWYLDFGFRQGWTRLASTKQRLDRRVDLPLRLDVLGTFASPMTPLDRKSDGLLDTGYLGVGRRENDWLTWNFYFGGGTGGDRDKQRWANLNLDVNFDYLIYYTGLTADIYPFGIADHSGRGGFRETLRTSRPYVLTGFEVGYVRAKGWGKLALAPFPIYTDEQKIEDWLFSYLIGAGWEFPINPDWRFVVSGHYTFHLYRPEEYNGWNITYALRYRF